MCLCNIIKEMMISRRFVTSVGRLAAVDALVPMLRMQPDFLLLCWCEVPYSSSLMIDPNNRVLV